MIFKNFKLAGSDLSIEILKDMFLEFKEKWSFKVLEFILLNSSLYLLIYIKNYNWK